MSPDVLEQIQVTRKQLSEKKKENSKLEDDHRKNETDIEELQKREGRLVNYQYDDTRRGALMDFGLKSSDPDLLDSALIVRESANLSDPKIVDALVKLDQASRLNDITTPTLSNDITSNHPEAKKQPEENRDTIIRTPKSHELLEGSYQMDSLSTLPVQVQKKKIFISHSSKDIDAVSHIVHLLEQIGFSEDNMFCSSIQPFGIPTGTDIYDYLKKQFRDYELHVIFVLSNNYYNSVACLNEMGAAWVLSCSQTMMLLPGFSFGSIEGAINPRSIGIQFKSNLSTNELYNLRDRIKTFIEDMTRLCGTKAKIREATRDEFIDKMNAYNETTA